MTPEELSALQAPLKTAYRADASMALVKLRAEGRIGDGITCEVDGPTGPIVAGLHPATGGTGEDACSADMLLQALVACAGVTLRAVATSLEIPLAGAAISAEGELDFRGTLGVSKDAPVGFRAIRLSLDLDTDADESKIAKLVELTERYCVVAQTLRAGCPTSVSWKRA
jgi:uncharacterized OsmC-like protein